MLNFTLYTGLLIEPKHLTDADFLFQEKKEAQRATSSKDATCIEQLIKLKKNSEDMRFITRIIHAAGLTEDNGAKR